MNCSRSIPLALAFVAALPVLARAQTAVVLPISGDEELVEARGAEALARVVSDLEESSMTVLSGPALTRALGAVGADGCSDPTCAGRMLRALSAEIGVSVALARRHGAIGVSVVLVDAQDRQVSASADGTEGVIGQVTQAALSQARARWATRDGAPVQVIGSPEGATIVIDDQPWGTVPGEGTLSPGAHHVVVSADGHTAESRDVEIQAATETQTLAFELAPIVAAVAPPPVTPSGGPDLGLIIAGAVTGAVGAGVMIAGIVIATNPEHCVRGCNDPPVDRVVSVPATDAGVGLSIAGGVTLAVGVVLVVVGALSGPSSATSTVALTADGFALHF